MVYVYNSMIVYGMYMTFMFSDYWYDIECKGQGQIYLQFVLWVETQIAKPVIYNWCS